MPDPSLPTRERLQAALLAHVDWIDENALAYRTVLQGGHSGDPEVQAIIEASRAEVLERLARDAGLTTVEPVLRIAVRGWVGFLEGACLEWLDTKDITKQELVHLIANLLPPTIRATR